MPDKPMTDIAVLRLNTSAQNFGTWLASHYWRGEFPLHDAAWLIQSPLPACSTVSFRLDVKAVSSPAPWDDDQSEGSERAPELAIRFTTLDIGTERDARVEVTATCHTRSLFVLLHFKSVLACIADAWPEALPDLDRARRLFRQDRGGPAPAPDSSPWLQIPEISWDREAVRLLHQDYTAAEIARRVGAQVTAKTVHNRLSELRKRYGTAVVPHRRSRPRRE